MPGELNAQQIDDVLHAALIGRLGCRADGRTCVVPVTYAYADGCVYGRSGSGMKLRMRRANPELCFEVEQAHEAVVFRIRLAEKTDHFEKR